MIRNEALELAEECIYLGQIVSANPAHEKEIRRIGISWSAFGKQSLVVNNNMPLSLKRKIYKQCILLVLTYGSETWRLTKELVRKLRSAQRNREKNAGYKMEKQEKSIMDQGTDEGCRYSSDN